MPFDTKYAFTASDRRTESAWLYASLPTESACPMAITTSRLMPFILFARSSSFDLPSGLITDLSKSNSTSAAKVIFSATGLGLAASGAGFGAGAGVEGAGAGTGAGAGAGAGASWVAHPAANASAPSQSHVLVFIFSLPPCLKLVKTYWYQESA